MMMPASFNFVYRYIIKLSSFLSSRSLLNSIMVFNFVHQCYVVMVQHSNVYVNILLHRTLLWRILQIYMILLSPTMQLRWVICVFCTFWSTMNRCLTCPATLPLWNAYYQRYVITCLEY